MNGFSFSLRAVSIQTILVTIALLFNASALAQLKVGDEISLPELEDQFEVKHALKASTQWVLFCKDMDGTKIIRGALEEQTEENLNAKGIQVYADISGMPGFVRRFIAMPKLKKLAYPMILARDEELLEAIPREEDKATVLALENGKIKAITIVDSIEQLQTLVAL